MTGASHACHISTHEPEIGRMLQVCGCYELGWSRRKHEFCIQNLYLGEVFRSPLGLQGVLGDWVLSYAFGFEAHEQRYIQQVIEWQGLWSRRGDGAQTATEVPTGTR